MPEIVELSNPPASKAWPYITTIVVIPVSTIIGAVMISTIRPNTDNAALITQILGFGVTITVAMLAYLKSADTGHTVNSRMDEFKRTIQLASDAAVAKAFSDGKDVGIQHANERTDALAATTDATRKLPIIPITEPITITIEPVKK